VRKPSIYVGTSGWLYDWNKGGNFEWYVRYSGLNAIELNASFYRFPFRSQVERWAKRSPTRLRWSVKVHRIITHYRKLTPSSLEVWRKFRELFKPLEIKGVLDFYLFQMPPSFHKNPSNVTKIVNFIKMSEVKPERIALEFRHESWFTKDTVELGKSLGIVIVSVDSPMISWITRSDGTIYLRMHGRSAWYAHDYSKKELEEVVRKILELNPKKVYIFFNNNHWMLENARLMLKMLREAYGLEQV
jgi:uncharacterized protein YecE (DUF72 family)